MITDVCSHPHTNTGDEGNALLFRFASQGSIPSEATQLILNMASPFICAGRASLAPNDKRCADGSLDGALLEKVLCHLLLHATTIGGHRGDDE